MTKYRVSYSDDHSGVQIATDGAVEMELAKILELMDKILGTHGSFINVADDAGNLITFFADEEPGALLLDMPSPREKGSYAKRATLAECKTVLTGLAGKIDRGSVEGLVFERW